ncbi:tyrosine-type recombinase/integrase [Synechococcus sp. CS-1333]|uniref:tyrosine-type recombinase/integrase n=1 Tax=Synechococcus sp. CS-1333 TaxID=2848638 RepID=UPI0037DA2475
MSGWQGWQRLRSIALQWLCRIGSGWQRGGRNPLWPGSADPRATNRMIRHNFETLLLERSHVNRTIQELLEHSDVKTTMIYTHVLNRGPAGVQSQAVPL